MTGQELEPRDERGKGLPGWMVTSGVGLASAVVVGGALSMVFGFVPIAAGVIGAAAGIGGALMTAPLAQREIKLPETTPTTVEGLLDASALSARKIEQAMKRLSSHPLWAGTLLDERIEGMIRGIHSLANSPALRSRTAVDGEVRMLYSLSTDYLSTIVNLAIQNDNMHMSFSGTGSKKQVEENVRTLEQQAAVLGDVLDQLETDIARGTHRDIAEHESFLRSRFARFGDDSPLDLSRPFNTGGGASAG